MSAWAVSTKNLDYIKKKGWEEIVVSKEHRKELVAGNLADHAIAGELIYLSMSYLALSASLVTRV